MTVLFVGMTILLFLVLDAVVRRSRARADVADTDVSSVARGYPVRLPEGIFFSRSHTWMSLLPFGEIRLGVDDFVVRLLDSPTISYLKGPRQRVHRGDPILVLTEGGHSLTIRAPLDGEILERNDRFIKAPRMINETPLADGWAYVIVPARYSDVKQLLLGEETRGWIAEEFCRLRDLFAQEGGTSEIIPALLQDGGPPVHGALRCVHPQTWEQFDRMFLRDA